MYKIFRAIAMLICYVGISYKIWTGIELNELDKIFIVLSFVVSFGVICINDKD